MREIGRQCYAAKIPIFIKQDSGLKSERPLKINGEFWMQVPEVVPEVEQIALF